MNWKQVNQKLAEEFNLPLRVVEDHTNTYWQDLRKQLSKPTKSQFRVLGLGTWIVPPKKLMKAIAHGLIQMRKIRAGLITEERSIYKIEGKVNENFPILWKLKQILKIHMTSTKKSPKEVVNQLVKDKQL